MKLKYPSASSSEMLQLMLECGLSIPYKYMRRFTMPQAQLALWGT